MMTLEEITKQIGRNIKKIREGQDIFQQDLAAMCNYDTSTMSRIEGGGSNFTVETLTKVAHALKVPLKDLFEDCY